MSTAHTSRFRKRFLKNKAALVSVVFILLVMLVAVFAYPLSPDDSPDANTMTLEIATRKPGFSCLFLKKPRTEKNADEGLLSYLLYGREKNEEWIPIRALTLFADSVVVQKVMDETLSERLAFPRSDWGAETLQNKEDFLTRYTETKTFWLGTDRYGRDMLSRLLL